MTFLEGISLYVLASFTAGALWQFTGIDTPDDDDETPDFACDHAGTLPDDYYGE